MIECKKLSCSYGRQFSKSAVSSVSLCAKDGRACVILGLNGSGKTTLLRAISGRLRYSGSAKIDGAEVSALKPRMLASRLSVMPQRLPEPKGVSVEDLVTFARSPYMGHSQIMSEKDRLIVSEAIKQVGMSSYSQRRLTELSGGEKQKAFLAMLLAQQTDNVILDEPTANLDVSNKQELLRFIIQMKAKGKAILCVLHDLNDALSIADEICVIEKGESVFFGTKEEFLEQKIAQRCFNVKEISAEGRTFFISNVNQ